MHVSASKSGARPALFVALIGLASLGATCKGEPPPAPTRIEVPPEPDSVAETEPVTLEGVELARVPPSLRADAVRLLGETFCYCGCARTVASCLADREACSCVSCSERVAEIVLSAFEAGASASQVESLSVELFSEAYNAPAVEFDLSEQPKMGAEHPRHTLVEFADFRCPHCQSAFGELTRFVKSRPDVQLAYHYFPLGHFGQTSIDAARAAECARRQGKFWEMAQLLYTHQQTLELANIRKYAEEAGLDMKKFDEDMKDEATLAAVTEDKQVGTRAGVEGTPTVFVNGRPLGLGHDPESLTLRLAMENDRDACN